MTFDEIAAFALGPFVPPEEAMKMAATLLIDTLGVAAGAVDLAPARIARDHAVRFMAAGTPRDAATLLFDGRRASVPGVSFALATQIDNLDAHDGYNPTKGHIGCAVVPGLCAFAEHMPDLGARDALVAMVMSYELSARAAIALHASVSDYHTSGAWNALGVAALGCRLRGMKAGQLRHALGIAEYHGPRSQMMREIANPTMLHDGSGMGALVGSMSALMAEDGFEGAPAITLEAPEAAPHWADLGENWTITQNYIKPYPICRWAHAALDALGVLMDDNALVADDIARIDVTTFAQAASLYAGMPDTTSKAQYSLGFALAVRAVHGRIGPEHVSGAGLCDADVADVLPRITVTEDARHSSRFPLGRWSDVTLTLRDGRVLASGDAHARGGPEAPMTLAEVEAKFHAMSGALPETRKRAIWGMRAKLLDPTTRFGDLLSLLHAPADQD
ncbi:MmgE/PrpD family protein [Tateyamaria armeniaca]|uniref:MmgE/PrpD family protein n=1 Tax=Tateyamaria armeniaca TaxID=2518930 RepID=A0ABW8UYA5_9RHOB